MLDGKDEGDEEEDEVDKQSTDDDDCDRILVRKTIFVVGYIDDVAAVVVL